jgi:hypothetical protein
MSHFSSSTMVKFDTHLCKKFGFRFEILIDAQICRIWSADLVLKTKYQIAWYSCPVDSIVAPSHRFFCCNNKEFWPLFLWIYMGKTASGQIKSSRLTPNHRADQRFDGRERPASSIRRSFWYRMFDAVKHLTSTLLALFFYTWQSNLNSRTVLLCFLFEID